MCTDHKNLEAKSYPTSKFDGLSTSISLISRFAIYLGGGGNNFLADTVSRMPQYNSAREVINSIIPSKQIAVPALTRQQQASLMPVAEDLVQTLRGALVEDEWFQQHQNELFMRDGLAWMRAKLYILENQWAQVLQCSHDTKVVGHFGFVKTLHLVK